MKLQSIEWLRDAMKGVEEYRCRCGKTFWAFDTWWNHCIISKHIIIDDMDIEHLKDFSSKV